MSPIEYRFIEPLDVLFLRGNKLFGDPGSQGDSLIPPWPSVAAGAIRSRMLADDDIDLNAFGQSKVPHPTLGTPRQPGSFTVVGFHLARRQGRSVEVLMAPPADLVISRHDDGKLTLHAMHPQALPSGLLSSSALPLTPLLAQGSERSKAIGGYWLSQAGWQRYVQGELPSADMLIHSADLWDIDTRTGVGLDSEKRSAAEGRLFTTQAVVLRNGAGFVVGIQGARPPGDGLLRLGGDGRAAAISPATIVAPEPDYDAIVKARRCRLVLTAPGLFPQGWKLPGADADQHVCLPGIRARLASAAVPRADTISGWDLANWQPKPAQRVAPTGSVYWLDELDATPEALRKLAASGLWGEPCEDDARRAEGFNRIALTLWK
jgi:CRISPR-associated protein Cmr3